MLVSGSGLNAGVSALVPPVIAEAGGGLRRSAGEPDCARAPSSPGVGVLLLFAAVRIRCGFGFGFGGELTDEGGVSYVLFEEEEEGGTLAGHHGLHRGVEKGS